MKFKVTPKDFKLFVIYCIILLYFCSIAVTNFVSFTNDGNFYGFNPIGGFTHTYIGYTLGLFLAVLILIFTSVSSKIFDRDKGHGIGLTIADKPSDGYAKWANEKEIKNDKGMTRVCPDDKNISAAGIPLVNKGKEMWVDNGEYHNLIIGATGSGKTECIVKPLVNLLSKKGESMVITDPKGEIYEYCGEFLKEQGYNIVILNFRDPEHGNAWNPLSLPYQYYKEGNYDKAIELLEDVSLNILYEKNSNQDPFWERSAADYFSGLALGLFQDAKEKEVNLNSINFMSTVGEEKRGPNTYLKEYFTMKGEESSAYIFASNTITAPNDTKGSILSTFRQKIRLFSTKESLSEMLAYSDFDMRRIGEEKTAVFMIIHDEKKTYHSLMTIFTKQCYETLIDCAQKNGGKLNYRTNFILDEFANMPKLNDVDSMVTAARSRDIRFTFIIQNYAQLNDVYGEQLAQVIRGNCGNLVYLISTELKALEEISKMCGEVKSKDKDKTASTPLVTVSDLQKLKLFEAIVLRWRKNPFKTKLTPDFKIDWGIKHEKATLPTREKQEIQLFDVKKFVSEQKKDDSFNNPNMMGGNPFFGMGGFNPFMQQASPVSRPEPVMSSFTSEPEKKPSTFSGLSNKDIDDIIRDMEKKINAVSDDEDKPIVKPIKEANLTPEEAKIVDDFEDNIDDIPVEMDSLDRTQEIKISDIEKPVINVDKDSVVVNQNVVTDDEFYDDFFED